ncbi:MAG TPA: hypothetical protein VF116_13400 [Ktedonobacterales bacterium]
MATHPPTSHAPQPDSAVIQWLLDADSAIRWQALRDLTNAPAEEVAAEAIALVEAKRDGDGRWPLETQYPGMMAVEMDAGEGRPGRWNTLRASRVVDWWYSAGD